MAILLLAGEAWIRRSGRSPEWWDSWVIMLWGIGTGMVFVMTRIAADIVYVYLQSTLLPSIVALTGLIKICNTHPWVSSVSDLGLLSASASVLKSQLWTGWAGGALGIWLSRNNQRSVVPSLMYAPFQHPPSKSPPLTYPQHHHNRLGNVAARPGARAVHKSTLHLRLRAYARRPHAHRRSLLHRPLL